MTAFFLKNINEEVQVKPRNVSAVDDVAGVIYVTVVHGGVAHNAVLHASVADNAVVYAAVVHANLLILLLLM
jgi:hypothetical protein